MTALHYLRDPANETAVIALCLALTVGVLAWV